MTTGWHQAGVYTPSSLPYPQTPKTCWSVFSVSWTSNILVCTCLKQWQRRGKASVNLPVAILPHSGFSELPARVLWLWLFATPWTVALQAPLSVGFSRQEYWSGLPCPPPGDLPHQGLNRCLLTSPALAGMSFTTGATWKESRVK